MTRRSCSSANNTEPGRGTFTAVMWRSRWQARAIEGGEHSMKIIRVDEHVARLIERNQKEGESINDTVRRLIGLGEKKESKGA